MKKFMLLIMAVGALTFTSCSSDDDGGGSSSKSCEELGQDVTNAVENYSNDFSKEHCIAYKKALKAFIQRDCGGSAQYESALDNLNCEGLE